MSLVSLYKITDVEFELLKRLGYDPFASRREGLRRVLNRFYGTPVDDKFVILCTKPYKEWAIGKMTGRGKLVKVVGAKRFRSLKRAECEVLKLYCKKHLAARR